MAPKCWASRQISTSNWMADVIYFPIPDTENVALDLFPSFCTVFLRSHVFIVLVCQCSYTFCIKTRVFVVHFEQTKRKTWLFFPYSFVQDIKSWWLLFGNIMRNFKKTEFRVLDIFISVTLKLPCPSWLCWAQLWTRLERLQYS